MKTLIVKYQVGDYSGTTSVNVDEDADNEEIFAKVKKRLKISLPMYYQHFEILEEEEKWK